MLKTAKKAHYYKFLIKLDKKLSNIEIAEIKSAIQRILIDTPIVNIQGGQANNHGAYAFKS